MKRATIILRCPACHKLYRAYIDELQMGNRWCSKCVTTARWRAQIAEQEAAWRRTPIMRLRRMLRLPDPPRPMGQLLIVPEDDIFAYAPDDLYHVEVWGTEPRIPDHAEEEK